MTASIASGAGARGRGALLLADISGYTGFLQGVADAHHAIILDADAPPAAYALMSSLLETMVAAIDPPFRLVKLEGDALFAVAGDGVAAIRGSALPACLQACHDAFGSRLAAANAEWTCTCDACARIGDLGLKFVVHHGDWVAQRIAGREELLGPAVNEVHRLLKNHARDLIGARPYALVSDAALHALGVPTEGFVAGEEIYDGMAPIPVHVLPLA